MMSTDEVEFPMFKEMEQGLTRYFQMSRELFTDGQLEAVRKGVYDLIRPWLIQNVIVTVEDPVWPYHEAVDMAIARNEKNNRHRVGLPLTRDFHLLILRMAVEIAGGTSAAEAGRGDLDPGPAAAGE
jgi:hypothetical protein